MTALVLVAAGGALGAVARYLVDVWIVSRGITRMPGGTLVVNVSGSFGLGRLVGGLGAAGGPEWIMTGVGAGFLAAYTTFSTWMYETVRLIQRRAYGTALTYMLVTVVVGVVAAAIGLVLGAGIGTML